jgi:Flp pilus assembly protein CpaB
MAEYTITLTDAQEKALRWVAVDPQDWIENFVYARCETAIDEIVNSEVQRKLSIGEPIVGTKEEIVMESNIVSAADRNVEQPNVYGNPINSIPDPFI